MQDVTGKLRRYSGASGAVNPTLSISAHLIEGVLGDCFRETAIPQDTCRTAYGLPPGPGQGMTFAYVLRISRPATSSHVSGVPRAMSRLATRPSTCSK